LTDAKNAQLLAGIINLNIMRKILTLISVIAIISIAGCTKEGVQGPAGTNGTNGNANARIFLFEDTYTFTSANFSYPFALNGISNGYVDSSLVLVYYSDAGNWYPAPGLGYATSYQTRWSLLPGPVVNLYVSDKDGSPYSGSTLYFNKVKIVVARATTFTSGKKDPVDINDYKATMRYFGLKE
jgi:hypothetical protein